MINACEQLIRKEILLSKRTTIKTGGPANYFAQVSNPEELQEILVWARTKKLDIFRLGNGSNIVVSDAGLPGVTILYKAKKPQYSMDTNIITVHSGTSWPSIARKTAKEGYRGLEMGYGIPGLIGGSICMNAGIPDGNISDCLISVKVANTRTGNIFKMAKNEMDFGFRHSLFLEDPELIILEAVFKLYRDQNRSVVTDMEDRMKQRLKKQPYSEPSAGCMFRRTDQILPGKLIEESGCKGLRIGGAEVSIKHSNFIINLGNATSNDVWLLLQEVRKRVHDKYGVELTNEVQFIGEFT